MTLTSLGQAQDALDVLKEALEIARGVGFVDWTNRFIARVEDMGSS